MSQAFRVLLKKVASGPHTGKNLTRCEAEAALSMMLRAEATPAQIGGFLVAHRMKRPVPEEFAGILDAYDRLSTRIAPLPDATRVPVVLGCPYDGRTRTAPVTPVVALLLAEAGVPVVMHGGDRMATKYGLPMVEIWRSLGLDWTDCDVGRLGHALDRARLAFAYTPSIFPESSALVDYRDQIGKRPPLATVELMWSPYAGAARSICGFVHPPTEDFMRGAFALRGRSDLITVKGLEGSCDLPRSRTAIIGVSTGDLQERLFLRAHEFGLSGADIPLDSEVDYLGDLSALLAGKLDTERVAELAKGAIWSGGFYLWQSGGCADLAAGLTRAEATIASGKLLETIATIRAAIAPN
ncbi:MAG: anthranilate phosphoribosyltransferase family protein [Geitlerinemataceae cyanobacterium]